MTVLYLMPLSITSHHTRSYTTHTHHTLKVKYTHTHTHKHKGSDAVLRFGERQDDIF